MRCSGSQPVDQAQISKLTQVTSSSKCSCFRSVRAPVFDQHSQHLNDRGRRATQVLRGWLVSLCPSPPAALRLSKPRTRLEERLVAAIDVLVPFTYPWRLAGAPGTAIRGSSPYALAPSAIAAF